MFVEGLTLKKGLPLLQCNYNKLTTQKKELFNYLLSILPNSTLYAFTKNDLKFRRKTLNKQAIAKGKFLYYNKNFATELIFDIDNISHLTAWDLDWIYKVFYEKFGIPITWSCKTDKGIQFCVSVNTFYKLSKKQLKVLKDFKQYIIDNWALIDGAGSKRLRGWWRNPFNASEFRYYGNRITFNEILEFLYRKNLNYKQQFKSEIRKTQIKQKSKAPKTTNKIYFTIGEGVKGNRNNWIFYNLMLNTNSKNLDTIIQLAKELNNKVEEPLDDKELLHIAKNVWNYNKKDKNYIYSNSKKAKWNIGVMGFEKMSGLSYEEYLKETKRRQSMAGKRTGNEIGKKILIKANKEKAKKTKEKIYKIIDELKQKNEKVTIKKVKELANVAYATAQKYIKQAREEGII